MNEEDTSDPRREEPTQQKVRYAVVGLGYISQAAVLPAFKHASENSELTALVSDDPEKLAILAKKYKVQKTFGYEQFEDCLRDVDAVYLAVPNTMHADFALRAARAGVHVLVEKPMAVTAEDCESMIRECDAHHVKLMVAYRLHFEAANLKAIEIVENGTIGPAKIVSSDFSMQVEEGNVRLDRELGGGTLWDIGIYCLNAARSIFRAEPMEVFAFETMGDGERFAEVAESTTVLMRFPGERVAHFACSFGAANVSSYRIIGTRGDLVVSPAYEFATALAHTLTVDGKTTKEKFPKRDQFAPELVYFSSCILEDRRPEPSGEEGLADVRAILAMLESAKTGVPVVLRPAIDVPHPSPEQEITKPPVPQQPLVHASAPTVN
jgi:predicted dehydrogenase